jgi:hypothetical protein
LVSKLNFIGLAPGAILGLIVLARRQARTSGYSVYYQSLVPALLVAVSPVALYGLVNVLSGHPAFGIASGSLTSFTSGHKSIPGELSYIWQLYLPRLPDMHDHFPEVLTTRQLWFNGQIGLYGWAETTFPGWVYDFALIPAGLIVVLCARAALATHTALRTRLTELAVYAIMSAGLIVLVGSASYNASLHGGGAYSEPRYLLPLLALWGAVLALAARGAGRRWGPVAGTLIVVLVIAHDLFSQLQVIARYYG